MTEPVHFLSDDPDFKASLEAARSGKAAANGGVLGLKTDDASSLASSSVMSDLSAASDTHVAPPPQPNKRAPSPASSAAASADAKPKREGSSPASTPPHSGSDSDSDDVNEEDEEEEEEEEDDDEDDDEDNLRGAVYDRSVMPDAAANVAVTRWAKTTTADMLDRGTVLVTDDACMGHFDPNHPERPERVSSILMSLDRAGLLSRMRLAEMTGHRAKDAQLQMVHTRAHIDFVKDLASKDRRDKYRKTLRHKSAYSNEGTTDAAYAAVACVIEATELVVRKQARNAFCVVRPPGHHAGREEVCGFCLFNNVAVAASQARQKWGVERVLILDWDVHHGNGVQAAFERDESVLYISLHRWDHGEFYPGGPEGGPDRVGRGAGRGFNINIAWNGRGPFGDAEYLTAFDEVVLPAARAFNPDLVLVSAGFDAARGDPLGMCELSPAAYGHMLHSLMGLAQGKVVVALEGGYDLSALCSCSLEVASVLLGASPTSIPFRRPARAALEAIRCTLRAHGGLPNEFSRAWVRGRGGDGPGTASLSMSLAMPVVRGPSSSSGGGAKRTSLLAPPSSSSGAGAGLRPESVSPMPPPPKHARVDEDSASVASGLREGSDVEDAETLPSADGVHAGGGEGEAAAAAVEVHLQGVEDEEEHQAQPQPREDSEA